MILETAKLVGGSASVSASVPAPAPSPANMFAHFGSVIAGMMFLWAMLQQFVPIDVRGYLQKHSKRLQRYFYPYIQVTFDEYGQRMMRSEAYSAIENYLSTSSASQAKRLKADLVKNNQSLVLSMDDHEEVSDSFHGVKLWWSSGNKGPKPQPVSYYSAVDENRYYTLTFHKRNREFIFDQYLTHVLKEGQAIKVRNRQRKLYTNHGSYWSHVVFEHPATFQTLAMDPVTKQDIIEDLLTFSNNEEFYARIGRAWKRGYLLFGPPGTGKSTMIAAIANLLKYDIYDLELTAVRDNTALRRLLIETTSKSIIVIEDIDCSLDLTGQRKKKKKDVSPEDCEKEEGEAAVVTEKVKRVGGGDGDGESKESKVTLSGLLNFVDGLWSACGGERLLVFTTNHVEKLDPALVRPGRMDRHVELSYCRFEAFKILAQNYLGIEDHAAFEAIGGLLKEVDWTPADVAEHLMPKSAKVSVDGCLAGLECALYEAKVKKEEEGKGAGEGAGQKKQIDETEAELNFTKDYDYL